MSRSPGEVIGWHYRRPEAPPRRDDDAVYTTDRVNWKPPADWPVPELPADWRHWPIADGVDSASPTLPADSTR